MRYSEQKTFSIHKESKISFFFLLASDLVLFNGSLRENLNLWKTIGIFVWSFAILFLHRKEKVFFRFSHFKLWNDFTRAFSSLVLHFLFFQPKEFSLAGKIGYKIYDQVFLSFTLLRLQANSINGCIESFSLLKCLCDAVLSRSNSINKMYHTFGIALYFPARCLHAAFSCFSAKHQFCFRLLSRMMFSRFAKIKAAFHEKLLLWDILGWNLQCTKLP